MAGCRSGSGWSVRQPEARTRAPRGVRIRPCAQQYGADRSPHQMGQSVPDRPRRDARGSDRALPRRSLAPHPQRRDRAGGTRRHRRMLVRVSLCAVALPWRGAGPCRGLGRRRSRRARCIARRREGAMTGVTFRRIAPDQSCICDGAGNHVGDVYALDDPLHEGARYFVVHLDEVPRGPCRIDDRDRIREVTGRRVRSHPFRPWPGASLGRRIGCVSGFRAIPLRGHALRCNLRCAPVSTAIVIALYAPPSAYRPIGYPQMLRLRIMWISAVSTATDAMSWPVRLSTVGNAAVPSLDGKAVRGKRPAFPAGRSRTALSPRTRIRSGAWSAPPLFVSCVLNGCVGARPGLSCKDRSHGT